MAGHSKFKNIMHRKGAQDRKRARVFARIAKEITVAARMGGGDADSNPRLRLAIQNAKSESMPKDNVERAIQKGIGTMEGDDYSEMRYEGYGPGGVAIIVEALTDNKNRAAASIRSNFTKNNGSMGEEGSVAFMFDRVGEIIYAAAAGDHDHVFEIALEAGADDVGFDGECHEIICPFEELNEVAAAMEEKLGEAEKVGPSWRPQTLTPVAEDQAVSLMKLIDALDDNEDVQNVYANYDIADDILERISS